LSRLRRLGLVALLAAAGCTKPASDGRPPLSTAASDATLPALRPGTVEQVLGAVREPGARAVLVNVWATWCVPCREEFPDLVRAGRDYRDRGLRLIFVSTDFPADTTNARRFLAAHGVDFPTWIEQGQDMHFIDAMDSRWTGALPATFLYDGAGRLVWFHEGKVTADTLRARLEATLASGTPGQRGGAS
jgi:thiol-disulfide isomerase/thioredoxin